MSTRRAAAAIALASSASSFLKSKTTTSVNATSSQIGPTHSVRAGRYER
jgi:hypothetical protein